MKKITHSLGRKERQEKTNIERLVQVVKKVEIRT